MNPFLSLSILSYYPSFYLFVLLSRRFHWLYRQPYILTTIFNLFSVPSYIYILNIAFLSHDVISCYFSEAIHYNFLSCSAFYNCLFSLWVLPPPFNSCFFNVWVFPQILDYSWMSLIGSVWVGLSTGVPRLGGHLAKRPNASVCWPFLWGSFGFSREAFSHFLCGSPAAGVWSTLGKDPENSLLCGFCLDFPGPLEFPFWSLSGSLI